MDPIFWVILFVFIPFFIFALLYSFGSKGWQKIPAGRAVMILVGSIVLVLLQALFNLGLSDYPAKDQVRGTFLVGVGLAGWYLVYTLLQEQKRGRMARRGRGMPPVLDRRHGYDRRKNN